MVVYMQCEDKFYAVFHSWGKPELWSLLTGSECVWLVPGMLQD